MQDSCGELSTGCPEQYCIHEIVQTRRLTSEMRRTFITILRTPTLLAMFSKDPLAMAAAQGSLHTMALLHPDLIMPEILERAYGGLEVVNETHRTTAVLSALSLVALPLVSESVWLGGQKHVVPLLEMAIPGIDLVGYLRSCEINTHCS
jgi:proteasome activator subunit 4